MVNFKRLTIIKLLELIIVCILVGLHHHSFSSNSQSSAMLTMGTFGGYLIILLGLFIGAVMGTPVNRRVDLFFSVVGCILFIIAGALIIDHFSRMSYSDSFRDTGLSKGVISIIEGILFLVDAVLTYKGETADLHLDA